MENTLLKEFLIHDSLDIRVFNTQIIAVKKYWEDNCLVHEECKSLSYEEFLTQYASDPSMESVRQFLNTLSGKK